MINCSSKLDRTEEVLQKKQIQTFAFETFSGKLDFLIYFPFPLSEASCCMW